MPPAWIVALLVASILGARRALGAKATFRVVNGVKTDIANYPFMVSIQRWELDTSTHICGGTLISDLWILTAGHCVHEIERDRTGVVRVASSFHASGGTLLTINRTVRHEGLQYGRVGIDYDYGLIKLSAKFERAVPVRLVTDRRRFPPRELCTVLGWGATRGTGDREQLRSVMLPIVRQADCAAVYAELEPVTKRMVCAGFVEGGRDTCEGDSGGPLLCRGIQTGITSWASGCAKPSRYGVYSSIGDQREWIRKHSGV